MRMCVWLLAWFGIVTATQAADIPPKPKDFAYGMPLQTRSAGALHEVTLPVEVYRRLTRTDLGDLRVFNAAGEALPFVLRAPAATEPARTWMAVPLFPLHTPSGAVSEDTVLEVRKDRGGQILRIETRAPGNAGSRLAGYVLDAGKLKQPVQALEIEWREAPREFLGRLIVEASPDLTSWSALTSGSIAQMQFGGEQLERRVLEFAAREVKYLRLTWPARQETPALKGVKLALADTNAKPATQWLALAAAGAGANVGEYQFTFAGRAPVERARVTLPQPNTLARVELLAREEASRPWQSMASGLAYRLEQGTEPLTSPALPLAHRPDRRHWLLRVQPPEALGREAPGLELGWTPQRLVFLARGQGPFQLVYGAVGVEPVNYPMSSLLADVEKQNAADKVQPATLGAEVVLGGEARLVKHFVASWKKWLLWTLLAMGVLVLGWMARRLVQQMKPPAPPP